MLWYSAVNYWTVAVYPRRRLREVYRRQPGPHPMEVFPGVSRTGAAYRRTRSLVGTRAFSRQAGRD